jgi:hypothetical protein
LGWAFQPDGSLIPFPSASSATAAGAPPRGKISARESGLTAASTASIQVRSALPAPGFRSFQPQCDHYRANEILSPIWAAGGRWSHPVTTPIWIVQPGNKAQARKIKAAQIFQPIRWLKSTICCANYSQITPFITPRCHLSAKIGHRVMIALEEA